MTWYEKMFKETQERSLDWLVDAERETKIILEKENKENEKGRSVSDV